MSVKRQSGTTFSWEDLPLDLLTSIAKRLDITSRICLSAVCTSWASAIIVPSFPSFHRDRPIPWLLLSARKDSKTNTNCTDITFYDLATVVSYHVTIPIQSLWSHCWIGSNKGWLVTVDPHFQYHLIKPLTGTHVHLPSDGIQQGFYKKVILCRTPDHADGFLAVAMNRLGKMVIAKTGAESWSLMSSYNLFADVVFHKGKLYAITAHSLVSWDLVGSSFGRERYFGMEIKTSNWCPRNLIDWRGELVVLIANRGHLTRFEINTITDVELYKLKFEDSSWYWSRVRRLGDDSLFVGSSYSYAVSTSGLDNVRRNCVYFTSEVWGRLHEHKAFPSNSVYGVYDLGEDTYTSSNNSYNQSPIWFYPC